MTTFADVLRNDLGRLKDFELDVKLKEVSPPVYHKSRNVLHAIKNDLSDGYMAGIDKGVFKKVTLKAYGTPAVP